MKTLYPLLLLIFFPALIYAQQRDSRVREYVSPTRIVWQQNASNITNEEILLEEGNGQADLANLNVCKITSTEDVHPSILLDFGKERQGGLQFVTGMPSDQRPIKIRVRLGESVSEAMCDIDGKNGATNDHAIRDFEMLLPWLGVAEIGNSGFRFARIDLIDDNRELQLKEIRAVSVFRDLPYLGSFECSDTLLNNIWQTGAYTVHLNMQEYLWDGIKRDRLVWIGDMHPEVMTICRVFGYNEVIPKSLDLIRDITPLPGWMNGISTYSISWLLIQKDASYYQKDASYLLKQQDYFKPLLRLLISKVDANGVEQLDGFRFVDWPSDENKTAVDCGLQALMIEAMNAGKELCLLVGDDSLANECEKTAVRLTKAARKHKEKLLASRLKPYSPGQKQAAALMALSGVMSPKEANKKFISQNGAHGFSTFYGYYMLQAMAADQDYQGAMNMIKQYWGAMLDLGATTFWEDFNLDWLPNAAGIDNLVPEGKKDVHGDFGAYCYKGFRHSLCHGWASGPTAWLSEHVLGVEVLAPGCNLIKITPHLGDLKWAKGTFPTPYGIVTISHRLDDKGKIVSIVDAPKEVKIITE